jgi:hypothetical protein
VLSKMKGDFNHMNTIFLTSKNKTSIKRLGFLMPSLLHWGGNSTRADGFSFGQFAPAGTIQSKEVDIVKEGITLYTFNVAFHSSIRKGITL